MLKVLEMTICGLNAFQVSIQIEWWTNILFYCLQPQKKVTIM